MAKKINHLMSEVTSKAYGKHSLLVDRAPRRGSMFQITLINSNGVVVKSFEGTLSGALEEAIGYLKGEYV